MTQEREREEFADEFANYFHRDFEHDSPSFEESVALHFWKAARASRNVLTDSERAALEEAAFVLDDNNSYTSADTVRALLTRLEK